jgi:hypothetical protein
MIDVDKNRKEYEELLEIYLAKAEEIFGPKTAYIFAGLEFHNGGPQMILSERLLIEEFKQGFEIKLNSHTLHDRREGIFQLSHEVVHLLSPVEQNEGDEANILEEGMAVYFSKIITVSETDELVYCLEAINKRPNYKNAHNLYLKLSEIDPDAVKKLRAIEPVIANIQPEYFNQAGVPADPELIASLLSKF